MKNPFKRGISDDFIRDKEIEALTTKTDNLSARLLLLEERLKFLEEAQRK